MAIRQVPTFDLPASFRVLVADTPTEVDGFLVAELMQRFPVARKVTLASGSTFALPYASIRRLVDESALDLHGVEFRHLDEFMDTEPGSHGSLSREIRDALFPSHSVRHGNFIPTDTRAVDALQSHETAVRGSDLVLLGVGSNGHLAFNEPGTTWSTQSNISALTDSTRAVHRDAFARGGRTVPRFALTAGLGTILSCRHLLLAAKGKSKARAVAALLSGPVSPDCPASAVRLHDEVTVILDADAASTWLAEPRLHGVHVPTEVIDATELRPNGPVVVIAPHPDDAGISCGGLLASLPKSHRRIIVTWSTGARASRPGLSLAEGVALREAEARDEAARLHCEIRFLRSRAYDLGRVDGDDVRDLTQLMRDLAPAWIIAPSRNDAHPTHRLCRITTDLAIRNVVTAESPLEVWTMEGPWHLLAKQEVNALIRISTEASSIKMQAVSAHRSQIERVPFEHGAEALERLRGIIFSESHLGGRVTGGFAPDTRLEVFRRVKVSVD